jgi:single-strand DNA-binding protein
MINRVTLIGNVGTEAELKQTNTGKSYARFSLATSENYKDANGVWQKVTEWHNCTAWGDLAARASEVANKGALIFVEGKITSREYEKDGQRHRTTEIQVNTIRALEKKQVPETYNHSGAPVPTPAPAPTPIAENDLPF